MTPRAAPIARIRLARSLGRPLAVPAILVLAGAGLAAYWLLTLDSPTDWIGIASGGILVVVGLLQLAWFLSVRVEVEEAAVHVRWLSGGRLYQLTPGPVTRVRLTGPEASHLRTRTGWLGWAVGRALLRDEEAIEVVRLAPTQTAILVPTDRGRLAIAPAVEAELIDALSEAAHARQRQQEAAEAPTEAAMAPAVEVDEPVRPPARAEGVPTLEAAVEPRILTGIERALLEERLAQERAAAEAAAAEERAAAEAAAAEAAARAAAEAEEARRVAATEAAQADADEARRRRWEPFGPTMPRLSRHGPSLAIVLVPLVASGLVWGIAVSLGRIPEPASDLGRITALALVLAGPASSVAAIVARVWWPRLVGVVVMSGLVASVFAGRALFGA